MTKAENRAAAKAYQMEKQRTWREEAHAAAVAADLEHLAALRKYLIFDRKAAISADGLIDAIDDYVEKLTAPSLSRSPFKNNPTFLGFSRSTVAIPISVSCLLAI